MPPTPPWGACPTAPRSPGPRRGRACPSAPVIPAPAGPLALTTAVSDVDDKIRTAERKKVKEAVALAEIKAFERVQSAKSVELLQAYAEEKAKQTMAKDYKEKWIADKVGNPLAIRPLHLPRLPDSPPALRIAHNAGLRPGSSIHCGPS